MTDISFLVIYGVLIAFLFLFGYLIYQIFRTKKRVDSLFRKGEKDLGEVLVSQIKRLDTQGKDIEKILTEIKKLNKISATCFQRVGVIRFNPFKEVGGDQSFSIALLDAKNNGFIITGLYSREGNRIYAKPIERGQSKYLLSGEENEALKKAMS